MTIHLSFSNANFTLLALLLLRLRIYAHKYVYDCAKTYMYFCIYVFRCIIICMPTRECTRVCVQRVCIYKCVCMCVRTHACACVCVQAQSENYSQK